MQRTIRGVMFDLDGTLADSLADLANATNSALTALGCPPHPREKYRVLVGDGARVLCERAVPAERPDLVEETLRRMRAHYDAHCFDETRLYDGIPELVSELHRRGYRLAVLSNKPDVFTKRMIAHYFQPNPFDAVAGQQPNVPLKPDPSGARAIAGQLGIPAGEWLYLGDTNTDMLTAKAAGMIAVGVLWGFRDRAELVGSGAEEIVAAPAEVLKLL
ncbi:MAG: Phosphoglycolate phosphatase [Verrucomicrobiae bacterium]|nr:Phosphoglycolate phosphatase [Verrucomicrobiae bacterium]